MPLNSENGIMNFAVRDTGLPLPATWSGKDSSSGVAKFEYLVDESGQAGLVSDKYPKICRHTQGLKKVAS